GSPLIFVMDKAFDRSTRRQAVRETMAPFQMLTPDKHDPEYENPQLRCREKCTNGYREPFRPSLRVALA
nr:hypothetical protein [Micromonospora sp. DSM 115978]